MNFGRRPYRYYNRGDFDDVDWGLSAFTTDGDWHALDCSDIVPARVRLIHFRATLLDNLVAFQAYLRPHGYTLDVNRFDMIMLNAGISAQFYFFLGCSADRQIEYNFYDTSWQVFQLSVLGWFR